MVGRASSAFVVKMLVIARSDPLAASRLGATSVGAAADSGYQRSRKSGQMTVLEVASISVDHSTDEAAVGIVDFHHFHREVLTATVPFAVVHCIRRTLAPSLDAASRTVVPSLASPPLVARFQVNHQQES